MAEKISPEKLKEITKTCFEKNNKVEESELKTLMTNLAKELAIDVPTEDEVTKAFKSIDRNKDGEITIDEFESLVVEILKMGNLC